MVKGPDIIKWFRGLPLFPAMLFSTVVAVPYATASYVFLQLAIAGTNSSPVWPPSAIGFVAIWFLGYRAWPGIWLGAFIANILVFTFNNGWPLPQTVLVSALIGIGNTVEALVGVMLLRQFTGHLNFFLSKVKDIFKYVFSILIACALSATMGTYSVYFTHPSPGASLALIWFTWWLGDVVGILVVASVFLTFKKKSWQIISFKHALEVFIISLMLVVVDVFIFMAHYPQYGLQSKVTYLVLPFAIWFTYRFGYPGANTSIFITSIVALIGAIHHLGPFIGLPQPEELLSAQCFLGVFAITVLSLAAASSERQEAEDNLKYNEARFRSLVENSFEVIAMVDAQGHVIYTSPPTKNILGYNAAELRARAMFELIHPDDVGNLREKFQQLIRASGGIDYATCRVQRKDGAWRWMEGSGHNLLNDPAIGAIVINYRDVTERKLFQDRFEKIVDSFPVANIMVNQQGRIALVNKMTEKLLGYSRDELYKMKIEDLVPEQSRGAHSSYREGFHKAPQPRPMGLGRDLYALRKDGSQVPVEIALTPIETEEGVSVLASIVDITQRKEAEIILKRDKESLAQLVSERSHELMKAQNEIKQISRLADIGTLAASVAHELRNPLGVIQLAAYNLKQDNALNTNTHLINIEKKVWEGNQIIDNLLTYARIKIPQYENIRLLTILDECIASALERFADKSVTIDKKYEGDLESMEADPNQIREIFLNILNNACQALEKPGGKIQVHVQRINDDVQFSVQDTGIGIAPQDISKVFDPFFTRKSKGTGLGMTIVNELVNMHQGRIHIDSKLGEGTTVTITLPVHRSRRET